MLTTERGEKTILLSAEDLSPHVAHTVRVIGAVTTEKEQTVLRVQAVEHVSDTCRK
ncbi:MAG TPA: hypothetical protein VFQ91_07690 [Bryobacteraceae bacterium]|nr:hypothetical protein [Bryobacteraceae bacterium]